MWSIKFIIKIALNNRVSQKNPSRLETFETPYTVYTAVQMAGTDYYE